MKLGFGWTKTGIFKIMHGHDNMVVRYKGTLKQVGLMDGGRFVRICRFGFWIDSGTFVVFWVWYNRLLAY